jgi:hypothetical protein
VHAQPSFSSSPNHFSKQLFIPANRMAEAQSALSLAPSQQIFF